MKLKENDTIVIVGGGPAGSFFAIHYLRLAKSRGLNADLVIIDDRTGADWSASEFKIKGAVREDPGKVEAWMEKYPKDKTLVFY